MRQAKYSGKRLLAGTLILIMVVCLLPVSSIQAAKKQPAVTSVAVKNGGKTVTKKTISLTVGKTATLKVAVKPAKAKKSIAYKSSSPAVAKVSSKGKVTAKKAGTAKITVTVRGKNGKKKVTYVKVKVKPKTVAVKSVQARISQTRLTVGGTAQITAVVSPANATKKKLTYSSSNAAVASVNSAGKVTAKTAGTARITVKSSNGKYARVSVSVKDKNIEVERVTAAISPSASILKGSTATITAEVIPANATDGSLSYTSSNEAVASVDASGRVSAKEEGTATIKVSASNGKTAEIAVTVLEKYQVDVKECIVEDGQDSIFGKLYRPDEEGIWPAVILSHGYNGNNMQFETDCRYFAEHGFMAYAYDFCGGSTVSKSSGISTDMTVFTEKKNLLSVFAYIKSLEGVDTERIFLLGGSMGGLVTTLAAEELSTQVRGMVLYFPALNVADDWRKTYPTVDMIPETTEFWGLTLGKGFFTSIHDFNPYEEIGSYPNKVLIIWGDKDEIVPRTYVERAEQIYDAKLIVVPGVGHDSSSFTFRENALTFMEGN